jgi:hypothetical protein
MQRLCTLLVPIAPICQPSNQCKTTALPNLRGYCPLRIRSSVRVTLQWGHHFRRQTGGLGDTYKDTMLLFTLKSFKTPGKPVASPGYCLFHKNVPIWKTEQPHQDQDQVARWLLILLILMPVLRSGHNTAAPTWPSDWRDGQLRLGIKKPVCDQVVKSSVAQRKLSQCGDRLDLGEKKVLHERS